MDYLFTVFGTLFFFGFTFFCLKKGDEWGAGAFLLWIIGMGMLGLVSGTIGG